MKKNKILLINPKIPGMIIAPPLGLGYVAASLVNYGYNVELLDCAVYDYSLKDIVAYINKQNIHIIGIITLTPAMCMVTNLVQCLKNNLPSIKIILGGPQATLMPLETFQRVGCADFLISGEAENIITRIVDYINEKQNLDNAVGLIYRDSDKTIVKDGSNYLDDLDKYPIPYRQMMDINRYSNLMISYYKPVTTIITSRGCPYRCIYCSKPVTGSKVRERCIATVIEEIKFLKKRYGTKEVIFYDDVFTFNKKRIFMLCEELVKNNLNIKWKCETRVNLVDENLLKIMKKAGCYLIAYGVESGNQRILDILKKDNKLQQIRETVLLTKNCGIKTLGYFMIGVPTEKITEVQETISFAKSLPLDYCQFSVATAYPGTELYNIIKKDKISDESSKLIYSSFSLKNMVSFCDIPVKELKHLIKQAYREFYFRPSFILKNFNAANFNEFKYKMTGIKKLLTIFSNK